MANAAALIGIGAMGKALLKRLRAAGLTVHAHDISLTALEAAVTSGAIPMCSAAAAAKDVAYVHVVVASEDQTIEAVLGPDGVLAGASPGTPVLLHSTIPPSATIYIAEAAAKRGIEVLDAPITGVPRQLEAGESAFMLGGSQAAVERVRDYLLQLGDRVQHYGPLGSGNVAKLARAMLNAGERVLLAEVLAIVQAAGIDPKEFLMNEAAETRPSTLCHWEKLFTIENRKARPRPATNLFNKDVFLAAELAARQGLDLPLSQGAARTAKQWVQAWAKNAAT